MSDAEVDELLADKQAGMSLAALARKWGLSKSGVKGIVDGKRRAQIGPRVLREAGDRLELVREPVWLTRRELAWLRRRAAQVVGGARDAD